MSKSLEQVWESLLEYHRENEKAFSSYAYDYIGQVRGNRPGDERWEYMLRAAWREQDKTASYSGDPLQARIAVRLYWLWNGGCNLMSDDEEAPRDDD